METKVIVTYCVCDNIVKNLNVKNDKQIRINTTEILSFDNYIGYVYEDLINGAIGISFRVARKLNSKQQCKPWVNYLLQRERKTIKTMFSQIKSLFPKKIHAVTAHGFKLKIFCFILAHSFNCLMVTTLGYLIYLNTFKMIIWLKIGYFYSVFTFL